MLTLPAFSDDELSEAIRLCGHESEEVRLTQLLGEYHALQPPLDDAVAEATRLIEAIREKQRYRAGINALLNEFTLSSREGVVLMCLAEALLRVPDRLTADRLIRDKLGEGDWRSHLGRSHSMFVNASSWGLLLTGTFVQFREEDAVSAWKTLKQTVGRVGEPAIRAAMRLAMRIMGTQFVLGRDIHEAIDRAGEWRRRGYRYSYDMLGEGARTQEHADRHLEEYVKAIEAIGSQEEGDPAQSCGLSVKLSALHPRFSVNQFDRVRGELAPRLLELARLARDSNIGLTIDAEEADRLEPTLAVFEQVYGDPSLGEWDGLGVVVQAYLKQAPAVIDWLSGQYRRKGRRIMVRLVKGAYWDAEIKHAQLLGHATYPVFTRKAASDVSYLVCAARLLARRDHLYPQFATHNAHSAAAVMHLAGDGQGFEFQRLHGMGEELYEEMLESAGSTIPCRIYAPVGVHRDLLAYLVRRLLENGANSSFVNNIADDDVPAIRLAADPGRKLRSYRHLANPSIPLPAGIFDGTRTPAYGDDLADPHSLAELARSLAGWRACPPGIGDGPGTPGASAVTNPARRSEVLGHYRPASPAGIEEAVTACSAAFAGWSARPAPERAAIVRRAGDLLERNRAELIGYCVKEAGKTLPDALADVREAVDFCRYYAAQSEQLYGECGSQVTARGTILCISPWNFPVAIFTGQLMAALAAGNTVIAKPAEQTTLVALRLLQLFREAGVPADVLRLLTGPGEPVGDALLGDGRIKGVMFTGSIEVAHLISRRLAARPDAPVPLIAETGGQNAMVVDSTALLEQVVDDVITSGFNSAGQRCSALRLLLVQEDIADDLVAMLVGAMRELRVGDPEDLSTDIGPVIDGEARGRLRDHIDYMKQAGTLLHVCKTGELPEGSFFAPRLYEIDDIGRLRQEVFGPVVHVLRYRASELKTLAAAINGTGFGLTFGVHSRIEETVETLAGGIEAGNIYVNRNIIGAVVGVQPFGGHGLSGTGPKAGGPLYLPRLVRPRSTADAASPPLPGLPGDPAAAPDLDALVAQLAEARSAWSEVPPGQRRACLARLQELARGMVDGDLGLLETRYRSLDAPIVLPGPTGESNTLSFHPRGTVAVLADAATVLPVLLVMAAAALLVGNSALLVGVGDGSPMLMRVRNLLGDAGFPDALSAVIRCGGSGELETLLEHAALSAAASRSPALSARAAAVFAGRRGAILPVIDEPFGPYYLDRFVLERSISNNVTASGGNTALMSLGEAD
ncbi:MAG: bifunctional proline dehydrogenase/L-glutamate gamma-semialdehyde dehydrogenase PutA [Halioglobus sp.]